jgi:hypothetical protein
VTDTEPDVVVRESEVIFQRLIKGLDHRSNNDEALTVLSLWVLSTRHLAGVFGWSAEKLSEILTWHVADAVIAREGCPTHRGSTTLDGGNA